MKEINVPITIIETKSIELCSKDLITVKTKEDFMELCRGNQIVYSLNGVYYLIADAVAWIYNGELR